MASKIDKIKNDFIEAVNASQKKTSAYDTEAEVVRVDGNTAWVHIAGGVTETPVALTINAQKGDKVQVRVSNEGAWLMGNSTAPPTDDTKANEADKKAAEAKYIAVDAVDAALKADIAAQDAVASADIARVAAQQAQEDAEDAQASAARAETSAKTAESQAISATNSANNALTQLSTVESVVDTLTWIAEHSTFILTTDTTVQSGKTYYLPNNNVLTLTSGTSETNGLTFTIDADAGTVTVNGTASTVTIFSLGQPNVTAGDTIYLSGCVGGASGKYGLRYSNGPGSVTIYDGETAKTTAKSSGNLNCNIYVNKDTEMDNVVFNPKVSTENDGYEYVIVENPTGNPSTQGYYELDASEAVKTYVKSHLSLTNDGLYILKDASAYKTLIANDGMYIQTPNGQTVNQNTATGNTIRATDGTIIAHLGYGEGTAESGTETAPYYTLGERGVATKAYSSSSTYNVGDMCLYGGKQYVCKVAINTGEAFNSSHWQLAIGNYSVVEGVNGEITDMGVTTILPISASGYASHAEGLATSAIGRISHAEGQKTRAIGYCSHAEGQLTDASDYAHAEGYGSEANGQSSHAQNNGTIANGQDQTALGRYNVADTTSAVIIGNGTGSTRSNALTIDWNGDVNLKGQAKTSFKSSIAMGSYQATATTVDGLVNEVRFSSGCCGSVSIGTAYTKDNITISASRWYNFLYIPHRSGGVNGSASGDNCSYGHLMLLGMTGTTVDIYDIWLNGNNGAISKLSKYYTSADRYTRSSAGDLAWSSQADGDAKVIMKSALAFWNGAYNGTGSNLKYSVNGEILGKSTVKDYVVEQGTNYRKWYSGLAECWGTATNGSGGYVSVTFPLTFTAAPMCVASAHYLSNGTYVAPTVSVAPSKTGATFYLRVSTSTVTQGHTVSYEAKGRWK